MLQVIYATPEEYLQVIFEHEADIPLIMSSTF